MSNAAYAHLDSTPGPGATFYRSTSQPRNPIRAILKHIRTRPVTVIASLALFTFLSIFAFLQLYPTIPNRRSWLSFADHLKASPAGQVDVIEPESASGVATSMTTNNTMGTTNGSQSVPSVEDFLKTVKKAAFSRLSHNSLGTQDGEMVLIMGNEAGDLDSLASAVTLSYLLTYYPHAALPGRGSSLAPATYVPLIQTPRSDLYLRAENVAALKASGVNVNDFLMVSDLIGADGKPLDLASSPLFSPSNHVALGLVDHPSLSITWGGPDLSSAHRKVVLVVDHHTDESAHLDAPLRVIKGPGPEAVGSASSVIAMLFASEIASSSRVFPRELADLLIAAITIDTSNLRPMPRGKGTPSDIAAVELLLPFSSLHPSKAQPGSVSADMLSLLAQPVKPGLTSETTTPTTEETPRPLTASHTHTFWSVLARLKDEISQLSTRDLLRRDFKPVLAQLGSSNGSGSPALRAGFASVPMSLSTWLHRARAPFKEGGTPDGVLGREEARADWETWWEENIRWMEEKDLGASVVLLSYREKKDGELKAKHRRVLVILYRPPSIQPAARSRTFWRSFLSHLERDAHTSSSDAQAQILLDAQGPWKGARLKEGKRERVEGIDEEGRLLMGSGTTWAAVYKQGNVKANRKIVLPAVLHALKVAGEEAGL